MNEILKAFSINFEKIVGNISYHIYIIFIFLIIYMIKNRYLQKNIFKNIFHSLKTHKNTLIISFLIIISAVFIIDNPVKNYFIIHEYDIFYDSLFKIGKEIGKAEVLFSFIVACIASAMMLNNKKLMHILIVCLLSSMFASLTVLLFKSGISRERPDPNISNLNFFCYIKAYKMNKLFSYKFFSMPSGHTVTVFSAFFPLILYVKNKIIKSLLWLIPLLTAFSRVCGMQHWVSDVIAGAIFGIWIGYVFYKSYVVEKFKDEEIQ